MCAVTMVTQLCGNHGYTTLKIMTSYLIRGHLLLHGEILEFSRIVQPVLAPGTFRRAAAMLVPHVGVPG